MGVQGACGTLGADTFAQRLPDRFGDQDFAILRLSGERVCLMRRAAAERKQFAATEDLALSDADAQGKRAGDRPWIGRDYLAQHQCRTRCAFRLIAVRIGNAKHGKNIRADAPIGQAAEFLHRGLHAALKFIRQRMRFFRIEPRFRFQQTFQARDEDGRIAQSGPQFRASARRRRALSLLIDERFRVVGGLDHCRATLAHQLAI